MKIIPLEVGKPVTIKTEFSDVDFTRYIGNEVIPDELSDKTRLFFAYEPLELLVNISEPIHIHQHSAIKIQPAVKTQINIAPGVEFYCISLHQTEMQILDAFYAKNPAYADSLEGRSLKEFVSFSKSGDMWYIDPKEKNSDHIRVMREHGCIIAPSHSKFNPDVGNGWHMMYMRGSPAIGLAIDTLFRVRAAESEHFHRIMTEGYIVHEGEQLLKVAGQDVIVQPKNLVVFENPELRCIAGFNRPPYKGATFQIPSLPGDKYDPTQLQTEAGRPIQ